MKVLETVLSFFLTLAQVIFPRKRKPSPSDRPCPPPQPLPPVPPLPLEGGNGSDPGLHRRDSLPPEEQSTPSPHSQESRRPSPSSPDHQPPSADWLGISGYTLIACGGVGCVCRWLMG